MSDIAHFFGNDLSVSATGDLAIASGTLEGEQRVTRRLLTNPFGYIWNVTYGAGLGAFVGQPGNADRIGAVARAQMYEESIVAQNPPPVITVAGSTTGVYTLNILYVDNTTQQQVPLTLPVGEN